MENRGNRCYYVNLLNDLAENGLFQGVGEGGGNKRSPRELV